MLRNGATETEFFEKKLGFSSGFALSFVISLLAQGFVVRRSIAAPINRDSKQLGTVPNPGISVPAAPINRGEQAEQTSDESPTYWD